MVRVGARARPIEKMAAGTCHPGAPGEAVADVYVVARFAAQVVNP
ncbi:MAG: hypothetical protein R3A79_18245 [Nannocystaceae bacterium]